EEGSRAQSPDRGGALNLRENHQPAAVGERRARGAFRDQRALGELDGVAAGVAHEVGTPLGAILGALELARSRAPGPEVEEYLACVDREIARLDRTDFLLALARAGAESFRVDFQDLDRELDRG
ncbi:MAG: hypothetical protein HY900_29350, partial [Deltaproteobacteria bacterium]|nr:hypothetical protein [Deltaproteobacteria bacterium]